MMEWEELIDYINQPLINSKLGNISVLWVLSFVAMLLGAYLLSLLSRRFLRKRVFPRYDIDQGTTSAYERILHYTIMVLGIFTAFNVMNINLTVLFAGGAALLVGIGFGIQNIANNFISGVIILFERPIKVGDYIEVDGVLGTVQSISGRSSKILPNDEIVIIVPNSSFLEKNVVNWSYTNHTRISVPIGVKYGTDLQLVKRVLMEVAGQIPNIALEPAPFVFCEEFGDSSINMTLAVWIAQSHSHRKVRSALNFEIDTAFKANNIEIPFPQRDLHLKSVATDLKIS